MPPALTAEGDQCLPFPEPPLSSDLSTEWTSIIFLPSHPNQGPQHNKDLVEKGKYGGEETKHIFICFIITSRTLNVITVTQHYLEANRFLSVY